MQQELRATFRQFEFFAFGVMQFHGFYFFNTSISASIAIQFTSETCV